MTSPPHMTAARPTTCRSSRTFPDQAYASVSVENRLACRQAVSCVGYESRVS
jgi:hypothetical protein